MDNCFHCGDPCDRTKVVYDEKPFCCQGCKTVYEILNASDLSHYYDIEKTPGISPKQFEHKFDFLENEEIANKLLEFNEQGTQVVQLQIPSIHCSSCIWVLENLNKLNPAVKHAQVNFPKKQVRITFSKDKITLHHLVLLLCKIGYEPYLSLEDTKTKKNKVDRSLIYKLGVAGFAFGNIMFLSFPEYFEVNEFWLERFKHVFRGLMLAFSIPVVFYSGRDYFISAYKGLRSKILNIDVPIAIGIAVLFIRSAAEIIMDWGSGFLDSLAGLVFFLLLGKFFQQKTYAFLSFERDYKSYFPIAVTRINKKRDNTITEEQTPVYQLQPGQSILIRNGELIPVDGILSQGIAQIDYSFVTGESELVTKHKGDKLFAGGKQDGGPIEIEVSKSVAQSYLTQLWSNKVFQKKGKNSFKTLTDAISKRFTIWVLSIAIISTSIWLVIQPEMALNVFTAVLIVACPCAIALAAPFTLGNMLRYFGRDKLYLKDSQVIESMAQIDTIVFDKTGTLTSSEKNKITYQGVVLSETEKELLTSTLRASNHPLSRSLYELLKANEIKTLDDFSEEVGKGISGTLGDQKIKVGAYDFVSHSKPDDTLIQKSENHQKTKVHIGIENDYKGFFSFQNDYREGMAETLTQLGNEYRLIVLSGDHSGEQKNLEKILPVDTSYHFNQKPEDKLAFIDRLQKAGRKVMMIGDGLNDAGALAQSEVGIAVSENINVFSPACDGILDAKKFSQLKVFMNLSKKAIQIIKYAFVFSLAYNLAGLAFAVTGHLKPVVAAILMPLSSISIVVFTTLYTYFISKQLNHKKE